MANTRGPLNSADPTTSILVSGVYNAQAPAPADQQVCALQLDSEGNLLVNVAVGGGGGSSTVKIEDSSGNALNSNGSGALQVAVVSGGGSNPSVGLTGAAAPSSATEIGTIDGSGKLQGASSSNPVPVSGTVSGTVAVSNFPATQPVSGTVAVSNFPATQPVSGTVAVTQSTSPWVVSNGGTFAVQASIAAAQTIAVTNTGTFAVQASIAAAQTIAVTNAGTFAVQATQSGNWTDRIVGNAGATLDAAIGGAAPTNVLWHTASPSAAADTAVTPKYVAATAQAVLKASAGNLYGCFLLNLAEVTTTSTVEVMYIHFFNTTTTTSLSTTSWLFALPIPASTTGSLGNTGQANPLSIPPGALALANFSTGIVIVINTTSTSATTASGTAPVGVVWIQ